MTTQQTKWSQSETGGAAVTRGMIIGTLLGLVLWLLIITALIFAF